MIKVFGHKSPDTDATCSAIIWAWYLTNHTAQEAKAYVLGELNSETKFVLNEWDFTSPEVLEAVDAEDTVVLVDTNNPQELFENINDSQIVEIIDHHKLVGGLTTDAPPSITIRPLACTATVLFDLMQERKIEVPQNIAGLILSCILSDTLMFRSPTTTPHDKDVAEKLAEGLDLKIEEYSKKMFEAKSDISDFTDLGLVRLDSKKYQVGEKNLRISVIETTDPVTVLDRKAGILDAIKTITEEEKDIDDVLFFIVDIIKEEATVLINSDFIADVVTKSFGVKVETDTEVLPGIVSRKKQIFPALKA